MAHIVQSGAFSFQELGRLYGALCKHRLGISRMLKFNNFIRTGKALKDGAEDLGDDVRDGMEDAEDSIRDNAENATENR